MKIFTGSTTREFAKAVAYSAGVELGSSERKDFSDGEFIHFFNETVRGETVFLVQSTPPPADNLLELIFMIDAAKRAGATNIVAVIPYFGFARQDKKDEARYPIGAKAVARMIESAGAHQVVTMDLHADQIQGFFEIPVSHIYSSAIMVPYLRQIYEGSKLSVASPDIGGSKRAKKYSEQLDAEMVICYKHRPRANEVGEMRVIGDVRGRDVIIVDDMFDTAGTVCKAADMLIEQGATSVRAAGTHAILSGGAILKISRSKLSELIVTDSIPIKNPNDDQREIFKEGMDKIKIITVANLFADVLTSINNGESISKNF